MHKFMKTLAQALFYVLMFIWIVALVKVIMAYIYWDSKTIFTAGAILLTFGFIPSLLFSGWDSSFTHKRLILVLIVSLILSVLAYLAGSTDIFGSIFPNYWIAVLLQALSLGILSLITTERRIIMMIWIAWLAFSIVLMAMHLVNNTL